MASGGNDRQTGTVPKTKARNNCNVPQEVVTPTRRDIHSTNIMTNSVDWLPVSEHNSRQTQNRARKPTNAPAADNEYADLDSSIGHEGGSRFVPVRPQPRTLVLRQRDMMDNPDESAYNTILGGHSPHTSHTAVMIVNPTTPNSNQTNQNMNPSNSGARNSGRGLSAGRDTVFVNNTVPVGPYPAVNNNAKSNNLAHDAHDMSHQNGISQHPKNDMTGHNHQSDQGSTRLENARTIGDNLVTACPDTARVEQKLGQIREYIRVTSTLVDNMRNSEDEDPDMQDDSDIEELKETLQNLKDSEKKLEDMLSNTLEVTNDSNDDQETSGREGSVDKYIVDILSQCESVEGKDIVTNDKMYKEEDDSFKITELVYSILNGEENNKDSSMFNSEPLPRPSSVQSSGSAYSDNDLWQSELKARMEVSQLRLAAALQEQKRLLKYQADAKEQLTEMNLHNGHTDNAGVVCNHESVNQHQHHQETAGAFGFGYASSHQPLSSQSAGRSYGSNQIGVATTLPHVIDTNQNTNGCRTRGSSRPPESSESTREVDDRSRGIVSAAPILPSDQAEIDMLRDLQMRRQHLESQILQVAKMQNLHAGTSSQGDVGVDAQSMTGTPEARDVRVPKVSAGNGNVGSSVEGVSTWGREDEEEGSNNLEGTLKTKMAAVNVMKIELERLKNMLRTVDSIQNNFGINTAFDDYGPYENTLLVQNEDLSRNQNRLADASSFNNAPLSRTDSSQSANMIKDGPGNSHPKNQNTSLGLSRLQNCISSGPNKCTNVSEQQHQSGGENISLGLVAMQQLTQQMKQEVQGISDERRRIKHASNRDICTSSGSSIKSDDKKRTNSIGGGHSNTSTNSYQNPGPIEKRQLALKAELEAKKRQLERLMSKEVDHRTNQQPQLSESESSSKASVITAERSGMADEAMALNPAPATVAAVQRNSLHAPPGEDDDYSCSVHTLRTDVDNGYSSDQDEDEAYCGTPHTQLNINQLSGGAGASHKIPSRESSPENFKTSSFYGDSTQSLDGSFVSQHLKHNKPQRSRGNAAAASTSSKQRNREPAQAHRAPRDSSRQLDHQEPSPRRLSKEHMYHSNRPLQDLSQDHRIIPEPSQNIRAAALERESVNLPSSSQPLTDSLICLPSSNKATSGIALREGCDGSMSNNSRIDMTEVCSRPDSDSTSTGDRELNGVPPPMATLPVRHHRQSLKNEQGYINPEMGQSQWHSPHSESQVTMWWHNKANQLQQQLEMTSNLCQSLLQDRRPHQGGAMPPPLPPSVLMSGLMAPAILPYGSWPVPGASEAAAGPWWAMMQQQQQQQLAAAAWGGNCLQHMLAQQRELSSLRTAVTNLEERLRWMNCAPRARSTPPEAPRLDAAPAARANSAHSAGPSLYWNGQTGHPPMDAVGNMPWPSHAVRPGMPTGDSYLPKDEPDYCSYGIEHGIRPPANFAAPPPCEQSSDRASVSTVTFDASAGSLQPAVFNDCAPLARPNLNNMNPDCSLNMASTPALSANPRISGHAEGAAGGRAPLNRSAALNNQVPPGNRANNYWDNFRSYSRQNLLSGNSKTNADHAFSTHGPHPLAERSHNTLHAAHHHGPAMPQQTANTPKRNINNPLGNANLSLGSHVNPLPRADSVNDSIGRRGRRNLSTEPAYGPAPPDVLNVNQNTDSEPNQSFADADEMPSVNRFYSSVNVNLNRFGVPNSVPEIVQAHSNNLNLPRSNGATKKKSSSKLPAKNASDSGDHSGRGREGDAEREIANPNLASTSRVNAQDKSTEKLFDLLRENVYSEVTALISANESRPHFLIQLFRDLRQMSSDPQRQRALQSIQEVASHYLSAAESDSGDTPDDRGSSQRVSSTVDEQVVSAGPASGAMAVSPDDSEIVRFIVARHRDTCTAELLDSLRSVVLLTVGDSAARSRVDRNLRETLVNFRDRRLTDVGDEVLAAVSKILSSNSDAGVSDNVDRDITFMEEQRSAGSVSYAEGSSIEVTFSRPLESIEAGGSHLRRDGPSCSVPKVATRKGDTGTNRDEASGSDRYAMCTSEPKIDLIESVESYNGDLAEADQSRRGPDEIASSGGGTLASDATLPDVVDAEEQTPTEAEAEWLGLDRVPTRLQTDDCPGNQSDSSQS